MRMLLWQQNFSILALFIFLLKFLLKSASKSTFFCFDVEIRFWSCKSLQFVEPVCVVLLRFAPHCLQIAVEWLRQGSLVVAAACVILLCFAVILLCFEIVHVFGFSIHSFKCLKVSLSKSLLCVKASPCKSLLCVKACCV